jgi:heme/copper-type cytochrome/quinol oxidase subunit 4
MVGGFELESEGLHALFFHEATLHAALKVLLRKLPTVRLLAVVLSQAFRVVLCYLLALIQMIQRKAPFLRLRFYKALARWGCHLVRAPAALPRKDVISFSGGSI